MATRGYVPFIILSSGRSGSNLIISLLRSHPGVRCFGELLTVESKFVDFSVEGYDNNSAEDLRLRETDVIGFFQQRIYCEHPPSIRAVGFKPMYQHLPFFPPELTDWLVAQPDLRVIHSKRRNLLRLVVSFVIANRSGQWIAPVTEESRARERLWRKAMRLGLLPARLARHALRPKKPKLADSKAVVLTREECTFMFDWVRRQEADYAERFRNHAVFDIYYEDLVRDIPRVMKEMQGFLGLQPRALTVGTTRQNPEPLRELLASYDELREAFRGTEYAQFFDE
jgi:LPS sulfotransferase NodH